MDRARCNQAAAAVAQMVPASRSAGHLVAAAGAVGFEKRTAAEADILQLTAAPVVDSQPVEFATDHHTVLVGVVEGTSAVMIGVGE